MDWMKRLEIGKDITLPAFHIPPPSVKLADLALPPALAVASDGILAPSLKIQMIQNVLTSISMHQAMCWASGLSFIDL